MTTYTVTTSQNWDALSTPSGSAHTVNINGGTLTIDTDTRYNAVFSASTGTLGAVTISSTLGGSFIIDGTKVRLIPYNSGVSGNVPAIGTTISQGGVSATLLGVWSALNVAPTAAGAAMPASGFIKVKNKTGGNFAAGALTGIGASASAADVPGWIEVVGVDAASVTVPRLGTLTVTGDWFSPIDTAGSAITTTGVRGQTIQLPASLASTFYPGVWIETGSGTGVYEFFPSITGVTGASLPTEAARGKVVWISSQGLLTIGNDGTNNVGFLPPSGCRIRVPNALLLCSTAASPTTNTLNATLTSRYTFATTGGGIVSIDQACLSWYANINLATSFILNNSAVLDQINANGGASVSFNNAGVGLSSATARQALSFLIVGSLSVSNCTFVSAISTGSTSAILIDRCGSGTFSNNTVILPVTRAAVSFNAIAIAGSSGLTFTGTKVIGSRISVSSSSNITFTNTSYVDLFSGTTTTSNAIHCFIFATATSIIIDGLDFAGLTNVHPYNELFLIGTGRNFNIAVRNIGSAAALLSLGSANITGQVFTINAQAALSGLSVKRFYISSLRTAFISDITTSPITNLSGINNLLFENVWLPSTSQLGQRNNNAIFKGCYGNSGTVPSSFTNVIDTIFWDASNSSTAGRIGLFMNEATSTGYASFVALTGTAKFTGTGALYCPTSGDTATWTWPHYILGYTSLANVAPTITGGTGVSGRITVEYQLDKNDGAGFGAWKTLSAANLSAETGIDLAQGFKPKIRVTVNSTDTTNNTLTGIYFQGTTDSTSQQTTYLLENSANLVCPNFISGTRVYVARQQYYSTLTNSAINTSDDSITLGLSDAGFPPSLQTFAPRSLVRFNLLSGTIPTTSPQIIDGGLYYLKTYNSSTGKITLSVTSGGTTIDFTTAPTCTFQLVTETELLNTTVSGGSGLTTSLQLPTNATIRLKAIYWTNSGTCRASRMLDGLYSWNESTGLRVIDTVSGTAEGSADTIHNVLIDASSITMPNGGTITPVNDGSTITSLAYALEGVGKVQINANETDGQLEVQNLYLWGVFAASTADGIRVISADTFYAENVFSFVVQNLEFDNISSTPLYLRGGIIKTADGAAFVTPNTTGSIIPNTDTVGTGVILNLGTSPTQQEIRDAMALSTSATINSGSIDQLVRAAKNAAEANL